MAIDSGYWEVPVDNVDAAEAASLLIQLYAEYRYYAGTCENYAKAVALAVAALQKSND